MTVSSVSVNALLAALVARKVKLSLDEDQTRLRVNAPKGALTPELQEQLRQHKPAIIELLREQAKRMAEPAIHRHAHPVDQPYDAPLSYAQQRLWFIDQFEHEKGGYALPSAMRLVGALDVARLQNALNALIVRHEILRTVFVTVNGVPSQRVLPALQIELPCIDLQHLPLAEREPAAQTHADQSLRLPFDLAVGPLLRAALYRLNADCHILFINMHHIISDGWSIPILAGEVAHFYANPALSLPDLPVQYTDYAHWQREWLHGDALQRQIDYWTTQLVDAPALLDLPTEKPRLNTGSAPVGAIDFVVPPALVTTLAQLAKQQGATLYMAFVAAFAALLSRYAGQSDVVLGSPIANRDRAEIEPLIGFFVNTLALRVRLAERPSFQALLQQVRQSLLDAYAYQDAPIEKIIDALKLPRDVSHAPLFQVMLSWLNQTGAADVGKHLQLPGLSIELLDWAKTTIEFDLVLSVLESDDRVEVSWQYNADLFEPSSMQRMATHFQRFLDGIAQQPNVPVCELPLFSQDELHFLLEECNRSPFNSLPADERLLAHDAFAAQVKRTPNAIALIESVSGRHLSYAELDAQANRLAHALHQRNIGRGQRVAICLPRSIEQVIAVLGVLKAGAAYIPLDPDYPRERLLYIIEDAQAHLVLTTSDGLALSTLATELGDLVTDCVDTPHIANVNQPDDPFYLIYTSGTTGQPKGVVVLHRGMANTLHAMQKIAVMCADDRMLQFIPLGFDAAAQDIFLPLMSGAAAVIHPHPTQLSATEYLELCQRHRISIAHMAVAPFEQWLGNLAAQGLQIPSHMRLVMTGGEKPSLAALQLWAQLATHDMRYVCAYGPSEASIVASAFVTSSHTVRQQSPERIDLGSVLPNVSLHVVDAQDQLAPIGVAGELLIGGIGVSAGYWQRDDLTAQRFADGLPALQTVERFYRTGDLARRLADGSIEFVGRADTQVKIRGFRLELGEIEAQLKQLPHVREAVLLARAFEDASRDKRLVAYIQLKNADVLLSELAATLKQRLPAHMQPSFWVRIDEWPMTPNGKLDRNALPQPELADIVQAYVVPRTALEQDLAQIWQAVLALPQVGVESSFFDLGGHSLSATQVVSRVRQQFNVDVPLRVMFESPTIAAMADYIAAATPVAPKPPLCAYPVRSDVPLSFAQQRLWMIQQLNPDSSFFNMPLVLRLKGRLDQAALQASFDELLARHATLRTTFPLLNGHPVQRVIEQESQISMRSLTSDDDADAIEALIQNEVDAPFDLLSGPLMRVSLLRITDDQHILLLIMHHIIGDNWSLQIFMREFMALYRAHTQHEAAQLPELAVQYTDYAQWQREWLQGDVLQAQLDYWRAQLADAPPLLELPTDHPRPSQQRFVGDMLTMPVDVDLLAQLRQFCRAQGVSMHMLLLTGFAVLLSRYSEMDDLVIGIPVAGRNDAQIEPLIGFFLNSLALRLHVTEGLRFVDLVQQVKQVALDAYAHQDAPFEQIIEAVNPQPQLSHTPIFQVLFDVLQDESSQLSLPNLAIEPVDFTKRTAKFDINLVFSESANELVAAWEFNTDLFERSTIERMARHLSNLLRAAMQQPYQAVDTLPLLDGAERDHLLSAHNQTAQDFPLHLCMQQLFEAQVTRTPDAIAATFGDAALTYAQLNRRANRWAHVLVEWGVQADVLVLPFWLRGLDYLTAVLAIFKAGGAYLPIDPHLPVARLRQIIQQSRLQHILTNSEFLPLLKEVLREMSAAPELILIEDLDEMASPDTDPPTINHPDSLAYVIFTSGSTGVPKGVMVEQRGLVNHLHAMWRNLQLTADDVIGQTATQSYVISVWQFLAALIGGARIDIINDDIMLDPTALLSKLEQRRISVVQIVPSVLRLLVEAIRQHRKSNNLNLNLRWMIPTGEALSPALARAWFEVCPHIPLLNAYGSSECSDDVSHDLILSPPSEETLNMPAGEPIANVQMFVLDAHLQPVPLGVAGELYVGGAGVGRGYLHDAERTAKVFLRNPFSQDPHARLYKTGDRVRLLPNGKVEYLGRLDFQVKVRGIRIELGEIEATLDRHPTVRQSVVILRDGQQGDKQLVAYIVLHAQIAGDDAINQLRAYLRQNLPEYMLPAQIIPLDAMPLTANGKVARMLLPAPNESLHIDAELYLAPRNATEQAIVEILAEVMGLAPSLLGVRHNFFDLGGHSMQATQVMWRIRERFGLDLPLRSVFERSTVEALAQLVDKASASPQKEADAPWSPLVPLQAHNPNARATLYLVHPSGGALFWYMSLLPYLGDAFNVVGIQGHGLQAGQAPMNDVTEMARAYRAAIKAAQPQGPYHIIGYSMGGIVALEMAQQFKQAGDEIALLALLDSQLYRSRVPFPGREIKDPDERLLHQMFLAWEEREAKQVMKTLKSLPNHAARVQRLFEIGQQGGQVPAGFNLEDVRRMYAAFESHIDAMAAYPARPYPGEIVLFECTDRSEALPAHPWASVAIGGLRTYRVSGKHSTLMREPNVRAVGQQLRAHLEEKMLWRVNDSNRDSY